LNRQGKKPEKLMNSDDAFIAKEKESFTNVVGQDDLHRFDRPKKHHRKKKRNFNRNPRRKPNTQGNQKR